MSSFLVFYLIVVFMIVAVVVSAAAKIRKQNVSSDGHKVPFSEDLTCTAKDGHHHTESSEFGSRYIVHNEPEQGYVVLNGLKRKISDCKYL